MSSHQVHLGDTAPRYASSSGHLVADLLRQGFFEVRAVDIKPPNQWFQKFPQADNRSLDLREKESCYRALEGADHVYTLAADMGGVGVRRDVW